MGSLLLKKESFGENIKANHVRYVVNVTIESAKDFDQCSNVYVHYLVDAADYVLAEAKDLHGVTHQSRARNDSKNHFGHRFSLDVSKSWHCPGQSSPTPPLLLLEVYDVNMWNRQKSVGYGFTHVPMTAGHHSTTVPTWRPHLDSTVHQLQEYFLALTPQIDDIKYAGLANDADSVLCRYPFATQASGSVRIEFDTLLQKGKDVVEQEQIRSSVKQRPRSTSSAAVDQVIEAYHRARHRLKAAHDALFK